MAVEGTTWFCQAGCKDDLSCSMSWFVKYPDTAPSVVSCNWVYSAFMLWSMSRAAAPLAISDGQREVLDTLVRSRSAAHRVVQRA
jgi:hypothetical protein